MVFCFSADGEQTVAYVLTCAAVCNFAAQVFGIGTGFATLDFSGLGLMQIKMAIQKLHNMISVILDTPLETAIAKTLTALNLLEHNQIEPAVEKFKLVESDAIMAFHYAKGQESDLNHLQQAATAKKILIYAKMCIYSYDHKLKLIIPFEVLNKNRQHFIATELERDSIEILEVQERLKFGLFTFHKQLKQQSSRDMADTILKIAYPYVSQGMALTNEQSEHDCDFEVSIKPNLVPEGYEDRTTLMLGLFGRRIGQKFSTFTALSAEIWRSLNSISVRRNWILDLSPLETADGATQTIDFLEGCETMQAKIKISQPQVVKISSTGQALKNDDFQMSYLGDYNLVPNHNYFHSFVYQKGTRFPSYLFQNKQGLWVVSWIGPVIESGENDWVLRNTIATKTAFPPHTGWEYKQTNNGVSEWKNDDKSILFETICCTDQTNKPSNCKELPYSVIFTSAEEFSNGQLNTVLGKYDLVTNTAYKFSVVYKREVNFFDKNVIYKAQDSVWYVGSDFKKLNCKLRNRGGKNFDLIPPSYGWEVKNWENNSWEKFNGNIIMTPVYFSNPD